MPRSRSALISVKLAAAVGAVVIAIVAPALSTTVSAASGAAASPVPCGHPWIGKCE